MDEYLEVNELIQLKYSRMLYLLIEEKDGFSLENDELYQKLDFEIQQRLSDPEEIFTDVPRGLKLCKELESGLKARVDNLCEQFYIMKDMIKLQNQTIDELNKIK